MYYSLYIDLLLYCDLFMFFTNFKRFACIKINLEIFNFSDYGHKFSILFSGRTTNIFW